MAARYEKSTLEAVAERRRLVVEMTARGMSAAEIAAKLDITARIVQRHRSLHRRGIPPRGIGGQARPAKPLPPHGTVRRYCHWTYPCHCVDCRAAKAAYDRELYARRRGRQAA